MSNPKRDRQGPERTPAGDRDEARPGHPHTGSAAAPGGHADHDPTHGRAMPTEDGQVMDPLQAVGRHGHDTHAGQGMGHGGHHGHGDHVAMFRRLFWIMLVLSVPTVLLSGMLASLVGYPLPDVPGLEWVSPILGTVIYLWGGRPFLTGAVGEVRARSRG